MAHEIHATDRFGEVRKNGQRAWHGLGLEIEEGLTAQDAFETLGLGWQTIMAPVHAHVEVMGPNGIETKIVKLSGSGDGGATPMAHLRADNMSLLGMVTDGYKPFENMDLARFADGLAGADAAVTVETAGSLYSGRRVFALVKLPNVIRATAEDILEQYILVQNGHGGTASLACYPTAVRVVCANTLRWSETDLAKGIKFQHSGNFDTKLKQARNVLGVAVAESKKFQEKVTALVGKRLSAKESRMLLESIHDSTFGGLPTDDAVSGEVMQKLVAKRANLIEQWEANLANSRQNLPGISGTAWSVYNAVSEFHDHDRGRFNGVDESDARVGSNIYGVSHRAKVVAFNKALATV